MRLTIFCLAAAVLAPMTAHAAGGTRPMCSGRSHLESPTALLRAARLAPASGEADTEWLRYEQTVTLHADGTTEETTHHTGRILNPRGLDSADVAIPYDTTNQTVEGIEARTVRPDGSVLAVAPGDVHETCPFSDFTLYDDARNVSFSLPGAEAGAILDYAYTVRTRRPLGAGRFADAWWLAGTEPARLNRYTLIVPVGMPLGFRVHNEAGVRFTERRTPDGRRRVLSWETRDAPVVTEEADMPPLETVAPWVEVSTWPSWAAVARWYQNLAGSRMAPTPELTALARQLTRGQTTERAKGAALFYWVEKHTRYVAIEMGLSAYQPHAAGEVFRNRYGDCKDMATLLAALFHAAGIPTAWPALLDTEDKLPIHDHLAAPGTFDHAILRADLDGKPYWFDATAQFCPVGDVPGDDRGLEAFVVRNGKGTFETIPWGGASSNRSVYRKTVTLRADGGADCRTTVEGQGDAALATRTELNALSPGQLRDHFAGLIAGPTDVTLRGYSLGGRDELSSPLTYGVQYDAGDWAARTGRLLIVTDPFPWTPPFDLGPRHYPLRIDRGEQTDYTATIALPAGWAVEAQPDDVHEQTPAGTLDLTYVAAPGTLTIHRVVTLAPAMVSADQLPRLRAAFERFAQRLKQPLVLRAGGEELARK